MIKSIFRFICLLLTPLFFAGPILLASSIRTNALVKGWNPPPEELLSPEASGDNPLGIVIEQSKEELDRDEPLSMNKTSKENLPDFGSEQVFPFEPGLGNSAF